MGSGSGLGMAMIKLILLVANGVFFLTDFILAILFYVYVVRGGLGMKGAIGIIQYSLIGAALVFLFGIFITLKRKFILLKLYTLILAVFVVAQIGVVGLFLIDKEMAAPYAEPVYNNVCYAAVHAEHDAMTNDKAAERRSKLVGKIWLLHTCSALLRCKCVGASCSYRTAANRSSELTNGFAMLTYDAMRQCWNVDPGGNCEA